MGRSAKKKKHGGGGRRSKGRVQSKDHNSHGGDAGDLLLEEEITALCAIFQDDCSVISDAPPLINIKLRPHSKDAGDEDSEVSALLSVRCLPGYPYKCPKLQITPEIGLSEADADKLLSLLHDQANSNAREGRVMIYNLVEAAQEFLSEIVPVRQPHEALEETNRSSKLSIRDAADSCNKTHSLAVPFVYGFVDLFSGSGEVWHWELDMEENMGTRTSVQSHMLDESKHGYELLEKKIDCIVKPPMIQEAKKVPLHVSAVKLDTLEEESDNGSSNFLASDLCASLPGESDGDDTINEAKDFIAFEHSEEIDDSDMDSKPLDSFSSSSENFAQLSQTIQRDLVLAHLLRLACTSKGQLADALPEITSELYKIGIISEAVQDLATKPSPSFDQTFRHVFGKRMDSSKVSIFWKAASEYGGENASTSQSSRYINDFEELQPLGRGGFGHVALCKNKLDGRHYAVKKIHLKDKILPVDDRILREVSTLARLQHQHVVRYYQAWYETGITTGYADSAWGSRTAVSSSFGFKGASPVDNEDKLESTYLYIQMEYCPRTVRQMLESYTHFDKELAWHLFRQIVEGLAHIHGQGIIHRDLTPNNIFFGARNDIKIGDFGLAKFLKREQLDQDPDPAETTGVSLDRTGRVGTYFYTAPEIEQGWPKIDEKADMYSLGIVFFELWHPFGTAMERHIVLSDLKLKGELPADWVAEFREQASLLRRLMSPSPSDRPSATELLKNAFPPRMEFELLDSILRTMHTAEDTIIYDKVVNAIFEDETLSAEEKRAHVGRAVLPRNDTSSIQYTDYDTEVRDQVAEVARDVFRQHCAKRLEVVTMRLQGEFLQHSRNSVNLLTRGGDKVELCHELRLPFVNWFVTNQKSSFKRYEISHVYRKAIGHSTPSCYLQGDFDIVGGAPALTEAEVIKATMDIISCFFNSESCDIHINHGDLLEAIWSWIGIKVEHRRKVAELLSLLGSLRPQSSERKLKWVVIRRQLRQELNLAEAIVNKLQTVGLRFCGAADRALPRLRGALPVDKLVRKALDELAELFSFLRAWRIEKQVLIDVFMSPTENYHRDLFFQIYLGKENNSAPLVEGTLLAIGGRYDYLLHQMWSHEYKSNPPGAVGVSIALETIIQHSSAEIKPLRYDSTTGVLVCCRGGGGLLEERMELVAELWDEGLKAEFVPMSDPSLTEQYEYANEHDIRCLVIITDTGVSQKGSVKVRHLELKKEKEVERENIVKFLQEAMSTQFKNQKIWN